MNIIKWASIPLRLGAGVVFTAHGLQKTLGLFGGPGIHGFAEMLSKLGFVPALGWAYVAACVELLGGIMVLLGLGTRIAASLLFINMVVAGITVHLSKGFFLQNGGFEYTFILGCLCLALVFLGTGKFGINKNF